jgi:hypothetical protein
MSLSFASDCEARGFDINDDDTGDDDNDGDLGRLAWDGGDVMVTCRGSDLDRPALLALGGNKFKILDKRITGK